MALPDDSIPTNLPPEDETALREVLGYLNFSNGSPDHRFQQNLNRLNPWLLSGDEVPALFPLLANRLTRLEQESGAFKNSEQARAVLSLVFEKVLPAYRRHHADLLFHVHRDEFRRPFFVARVAEATLAQGAPWNEEERVVSGAVRQLNDFLGHRPVAVLENGRQMQPYSHERFRPVPLYLRAAGVAAGPHHALIEQALRILSEMPEDILATAYFSPAQLDELSLDLRAYDHGHPVYKRTNYTFGEWDPHCLDTSGRYRRFVVRAIILDALHDWLNLDSEIPAEERICEAAAVLAGTMLMASSVSGAGPDTHDSNVSLTSLLPKIARQRDAFYTRLLQSLSGKHGDRLRREAQQVQQPFGRIRQHLNLFLAHYGCRQMQRAHLAYLYARMGQAGAAREQAAAIPSAATRFETEIQSQLSLAQLSLDQSHLTEAAAACAEGEALLHRGIDCGALVDPWNILGFQGQFPLFSAREDSVADQRVDKLLALMEQFFQVQSRLLCEAAATGEQVLRKETQERFQKLAEFWDKFATTTVADLPPVNGNESLQAAARVTDALSAWHAAGEAAGDIAFWKRHVEQFQSPRSYATVIDLLLRKRDLVAAMNLLLQWLSESDQVALEAGGHSFFFLLQAWMQQAVARPPQEGWPLVRKFLDFLEVNAASWANVPRIQRADAGGLALIDGPSASRTEDDDTLERLFSGGFDEERDDESNLFSSAYENVVFRDSAQDGHTGDTLDENTTHSDTDLDLVAIPIEQRLRFLVTQAQTWRTIAEWGQGSADSPAAPAEALDEAVRHWSQQNERLLREMVQLMDDLAAWAPTDPEGDPDSLAEYDRQLHVKFSLLNSVISAGVALHETSRVLRCLTYAGPTEGKPARLEELACRLLQMISRANVAEVRGQLPAILKELSRLPLLYVPLDREGNPREILAARDLQALLRTLLTQLPALGLFRETWHVLRTAYIMERTTPPGGMSITEFDRLLEAALQNTLESLIASTTHWEPQPVTDEQLVETFGQVLEMYLRLWLKHSATMRLSSAEVLREQGTWRRIKAFIRKYGGELFHPRMLTMGNLRGIIQRGPEAYLEYLAENEDPLHPIKLLADLDVSIARGEAAYLLEMILRCIVEKFDRFLEYNTTTTQSDYGEQLHCLLDFLRLEADYERQAWNLAPLELAHEVLSRMGRPRAANLWRENLSKKTAPMAKSFLQKLRRLERQHGMRLPSVTDRLGERFVKPLALDRMLALVRPSMVDLREGRRGDSFPQLAEEAESYLSTSSGSALELQPWLQSLGDEVQHVESELAFTDESQRSTPRLRPQGVDLKDLQQQFQDWEKPL